MLIRTGGDKETVAEPGLEVPVFVGFVDINLAGQNDLDVARIHQEDYQLWSHPQSDDLVVFERFPIYGAKDGCNRDRVRDRSEVT